MLLLECEVLKGLRVGVFQRALWDHASPGGAMLATQMPDTPPETKDVKQVNPAAFAPQQPSLVC